MWVHCGSTWVKFRIDCVCVCVRACYDWREGEGGSMMYMCVRVCVCVDYFLTQVAFFFFLMPRRDTARRYRGFPQPLNLILFPPF